jgi:uncharacterized RDD family membrane protein YckC
MNSEPDEPALFDLPLAPPGHSGTPAESEEPVARRSRPRAPRPESLPLFGEEELGGLAQETPEPPDTPEPAAPRPARFASLPTESDEPLAASGPRPVPAVDRSPEAATAPLGVRMRAGAGDLVILAAVGIGAAFGAQALGGALSAREAPALLAFLLAFSFLYCVVSLAFWGQTPGMAWSGIVARTEETEPLSFGQTALRWLGHWLTWALLGVPALLAATAGGRSLADRLSGSSTYELAPRA